MTEATSHIATLYVDLFIPASQSLKMKRSVLTKLKIRTRAKFNVSVSELGNHDKWQMATLGICMIGGDRRFIDSSFQEVLSFIDEYHAVDICNHQIELSS